MNISSNNLAQEANADSLSSSILLLKAEPPHGTRDNYRDILQALPTGCDVYYAPLLKFKFCDEGLERLREELLKPDKGSRGLGGVVVTSPRASDAVIRCLDESPAEMRATLLEAGQRLTWYVVGLETARCLSAIGFRTVGEDTGSAASLTKKIKCNESTLLFLCGNRRRDTIPMAMKEQGQELREIKVYESADVEKLDLPCGWLQAQQKWAVFFSPSGVRCANRLGALKGSSASLIAIGRTTAAEIERLGLGPHAIASSPNADGIARAISSSCE